MKQQLIPRFAHLEYRVLHELEISIQEYFLLDMIWHLSGNGKYWCIKKLENIAFDMRMSRRGVIDTRDRLIERKLLIKGIGNRLRTSEKVQKVYFLDESELKKVQIVPQKVQKVHLKSANYVSKTSVENNRRLTIEKKDKNLGDSETPTAPDQAYANARRKSDEIRKRLSSKLGLKSSA